MYILELVRFICKVLHSFIDPLHIVNVYYKSKFCVQEELGYINYCFRLQEKLHRVVNKTGISS